jgi:hypothetical protein
VLENDTTVGGKRRRQWVVGLGRRLRGGRGEQCRCDGNRRRNRRRDRDR